MSLLNSFFEKGVGRSNFNLTHTVSFTAAPGPIIPVLNFDTLPKDSVSIKPTIQVDSLPLQSPCLGQFEVSLDYFFMPWRAVIPELRMDVNSLDPNSIYFPEYHGSIGIGIAEIDSGEGDSNSFQTNLKAGSYNTALMSYVHQSSLENYLYHDYGYNGCYDLHSAENINDVVTLASNATRYNGIPYMMYYMCFYYYYANWQSDTYIMYNSAYRYGTTSSSSANAIPWKTLIELRDYPNATNQPLQYLSSAIVNWTNGQYTVHVGVPMTVGDNRPSHDFDWYRDDIARAMISNSASLVNTAWFNNLEYTDSSGNIFYLGYGCSPTPMFTRWDGLVNCALDPDMRTSFIRTATRDNIRKQTAITVSDNKVFVDDIISATRIKKYLELGGFGASGYRDWVHAQFGVTPPDLGCKPSYLGRSKFVMDFNAVIATSADGLGDLGGRGSSGDSFKTRRYNFTDYGTFMALFTIKPIVSYRNGISLNSKKRTLSQCQAPVMDRIGWQPLMGSQLNQSSATYKTTVAGLEFDMPRFIGGTEGVDPVNTPIQYADPSRTIIGYQPAFSEYMAEVNKTYGDLATTLDYWILTRSFYRKYDQYATNEFPSPSYHQYGSFDNDVYVRPEDYQLAWTQSSAGAENFVCQIKFEMKVKRPIGKNPIPSVC